MRSVLILLSVLSLSASAQTYDVRAYGAKVDGVTNDLVALRAAVAAAVANRGTVTIPEGTLFVDFRGQSSVSVSRSVRISGAGRNSIIRTHRATPITTQVLFSVAPGDTAFFNDLSIVGPDSSGAITTIGIEHRGGSNGVVSVNGVYIEGFTDGIKSHEGTTTIVATQSEFARCGMGILFTGYEQGKVLVSGCTFRDTRPQTQLHPPDLYHGLYIYRQHELTVTDTRFLRITGFGVHLWDGDTSSVSAGGSHRVADCTFDSMSVGVLSGSRRGMTDTITRCTFTRCGTGIRIQEGNADISYCDFQTTGEPEFAAIVPQDDYPGDMTVSHSTFAMPAREPSAPGVYLYGKTAARWKVLSCIFRGSGRSRGNGVYLRSPAGSITVTASEFSGTYSTSTGPGAILNEGGTLSVDSSTFDITGDALRIVPRNNVSVTNTLEDNTVRSATAFLRVIAMSSGSAITIYGGDNYIAAGDEFVDLAGYPARVRNYLMGNRAGSGGSLASAGTITLSRNYDTWNIRGTSVIRTIAMAGTYYASEYGACRIRLIADSTFSLGTGGNIIPVTTAARTAGEAILLEYDTAINKWREVQNKTGVVPAGPADLRTCRLAQNYPNPFNPTTVIEYTIGRSAEVSVDIFDVLGRHITTLVSGYAAAGAHKAIWDATGYPSGSYIYQLRTSGFTESRTLLLLQ